MFKRTELSLSPEQYRQGWVVFIHHLRHGWYGAQHPRDRAGAERAVQRSTRT